MPNLARRGVIVSLILVHTGMYEYDLEVEFSYISVCQRIYAVTSIGFCPGPSLGAWGPGIKLQTRPGMKLKFVFSLELPLLKCPSRDVISDF
jgi:hypothetical protein